MKDYMLSAKIAKEFEWRMWADLIPFIQWPANWEVKAIPPMGSAIIRYWVRLPESKEHISIYLDCYGMLGACDSPYWEIYPNSEGDCDRFNIDDIEGLLEGVKQALDNQEAKHEKE